MVAISISNLRSNLKSHLDQVSNNSDIIIVPRNNKEEDAIVIMSIRDYNSMEETAYLKSSLNNHIRLLESIEQAESGKTRTVDLDMIK